MIGAILLAAGASRRFGAENKLLADLDGRPVVRHALDALLAAELPVIVVLGHQADAVRAASGDMAARHPGYRPRARPLRFLLARNWEEGMGRVIATGAAAAPPDWQGALIALGDMPLLDPSILNNIAAAIDGPGAIAAPVHAGRRGNPVGFGRAWFPQLAALSGDRGAKALLAGAAVSEVAAGPGVLVDCDTPEALAAARLAFRQPPG